MVWHWDDEELAGKLIYLGVPEYSLTLADGIQKWLRENSNEAVDRNLDVSPVPSSR